MLINQFLFVIVICTELNAYVKLLKGVLKQNKKKVYYSNKILITLLNKFNPTNKPVRCITYIFAYVV